MVPICNMRLVGGGGGGGGGVQGDSNPGVKGEG